MYLKGKKKKKRTKNVENENKFKGM